MRRLVPVLIALPLLAVGLGWLLRPAAPAQKDPAPSALVGDGTTDNTAADPPTLAARRHRDLPAGRLPHHRADRHRPQRDRPGRHHRGRERHAAHGRPRPGDPLRRHAPGRDRGPKSFKPGVWDKERTPTVSGLEIVGKHAGGRRDRGRGDVSAYARPGHHPRVPARRPPGQAQPQRADLGEPHLQQPRDRRLPRPREPAPDQRGRLAHQLLQAGRDRRASAARSATCRSAAATSRGTWPPTRSRPRTSCSTRPAGASPRWRSPAARSSTSRRRRTRPTCASWARASAGLKNVPGKTKEGHVVIAGNVFSDVKVNVDVQHARGVTITGNTFWMGYEYNLRVEHSRARGRRPERLPAQPAVRLRRRDHDEERDRVPRLRRLHADRPARPQRPRRAGGGGAGERAGGSTWSAARCSTARRSGCG